MALSTSQTTRITAMAISAIPTIPAMSKEIVRQDVAASDAALSELWRQFTTTDATASDPVTNQAWKRFCKTNPFLGVPPEIHLKIFTFLNPIDAVCLSLVNNYMYTISPRISPQSHPLSIGEPSSAFPVEQIEGCKHCVPVRFYPHHCELHYHLRGFIPKKFNFCGGQCGKYTLCEQKGFSDSHEYCGTCGVSYWRRYERGRRMLDMLRPGEKQERLCKWYNNPKA
ncbi:hypothetical protein F5882DRAFT_512489 [Hyaloscypha sp. PMI_1271]|nr:hypothetical protein F5882DRAFT_512489 [Hyaloscypha sp. PMI_1271]